MVKKDNLKRNLKLGKLGVSVAGSYIGYQLQNLFLDEMESNEKIKSIHTKTAKKIKEELQDLKGPLMKVGQVLSMQGHALPDEMLRELTELQMKAPGMHGTLARIQFRKSLGKFPEEVFKSFETQPFAAASLGQVHRAVLKDGRVVAVKIQYPGIRSAIKSDFKTLRVSFKPLSLMRSQINGLFDEIESTVSEEADYVKEANNVRYFKQLESKIDFVHIPDVIDEFSTDKVLVTTMLEGKHLDDFLKTKPKQTTLKKVGRNLSLLFGVQFHQLHALHADPHLGNYLFYPNGDIGLIDFGCAKYYEEDYVKFIQDLILEAISDSFSEERFLNQVKAYYKKSGVSFTQGAKEFNLKISRAYNMMFGQKITEFIDPWFLFEMNSLVTDAIKTNSIFPESAFLSRTEMGLYNILYKLKVKFPYKELIEQAINMR